MTLESEAVNSPALSAQESLLGGAVSHIERREFELAELALQVVLQKDPGCLSAVCYLADVRFELGMCDAALQLLCALVKEHSDYVHGYETLGVLLLRQEKFSEALPLLLRAVDLGSATHAMLNNLAVALHKTGHLAEAEAVFIKLMESAPYYPEARNNLGNLFRDQHKLDRALAEYYRAVAYRAAYPEAYSNMGNVLFDLGRYPEAAIRYQQALEFDSHNADTWMRLGRTLYAQGDMAQARLRFEQAGRLRADWAAPVFEAAFCLAPIIPSLEAIQHMRRQLEIELTSIALSGRTLSDPLREIANINFYLAYHGEDDLDLQRKTAAAFLVACPRLAFTAPHCAGSRCEAGHGRKIKLGILSKHLYRHTIAQLWRGLLTEISREQFEVHVFTIGSQEDSYAQIIREHADSTTTLPDTLAGAQQAIAARELDILLYPDIGMDPTSYFLAFARLAPVQCMFWGHPDTSAVPTIDYFLSGRHLETDQAQSHYNEKLVLLERLPIYYYHPAEVVLPRAHFGLDENSTVYLCAQSLFKFHPDFDYALGEILRRDPRGKLVLLAAPSAIWNEQLLQRFERTIPNVLKRVVFVPRLDADEYLGLLRCADVMLDPVHFGGGNTSYQGLAMGVPIVSLPSRYLRGRITYALYEQLGLLDCVVESIEQYIELACRLGTERDFRDSIRDKILAHKGVLFEDREAVVEVEAILEQLFRGSY